MLRQARGRDRNGFTVCSQRGIHGHFLAGVSSLNVKRNYVTRRVLGAPRAPRKRVYTQSSKGRAGCAAATAGDDSL